MVKRLPLRKSAAQAQAKAGKLPVGSGRTNLGAKSTPQDSKGKKRRSGNDKKSTKATVNNEDDEDEYWARIERDQEQRKKMRKSQETLSAPAEDEEESSSDSSDSGSEEDEGGIPLGTIVEHEQEEYTFEFNDMRESFTEGVTTLLKTKFLANPTSAYHVACNVTAQSAVGTAIVCEGGDDVFAFATVLPLSKQQQGPLRSLLESLASALAATSVFKDSENAALMSGCIRGKQQNATGLLLHRRFYNLPLELIGHLHRNLGEDLGWAQGRAESDDGSGDGSSAEEHATFKVITHMLLLAPCESLSSGETKGSSSSSSSDAHDVRDVTGSSSIMFENFEDDVYFQEATCAFYIKPDASIASTPMVVSLIATSSFGACVQGVSRLLPDM